MRAGGRDEEGVALVSHDYYALCTRSSTRADVDSILHIQKKHLKILGYTPTKLGYFPIPAATALNFPFLHLLPFSPSFLCLRYPGFGSGALPRAWFRAWVPGRPAVGSLSLCVRRVAGVLVFLAGRRAAARVDGGCMVAGGPLQNLFSQAASGQYYANKGFELSLK